jgi:DNA-binding NarL/FixJ family response regulator
VLVLTTFDEEEYLYEALRVGTSGFLLKVSPPEQLIGAIRTVAAGNALIDPAVTRRVIEAFGRRVTTAPPPPAYEELTAREREVLGLRDRVQAVVFAYEHGIVTPGGDANP